MPRIALTATPDPPVAFRFHLGDAVRTRSTGREGRIVGGRCLGPVPPDGVALAYAIDYVVHPEYGSAFHALEVDLERRRGGPTPLTRRRVVSLVALGLLAAPLAAEAQPAGRRHRIGVLGTADGPGWQAFRGALQSLGYLEGKTIDIDWRWAGGDARRFADLAAELVRLPVELIVTGADPAPSAARNATRTLPIVIIAAADPVGSGLVASRAQPGGNVTGLTVDVSPDAAGKQLELLRDMHPGLAGVGVFWNRDAGSWVSRYLSVLRSSATTLGLSLYPVEVRRPEEIAPAFAALTHRSVQAVYVMWNQVTYAHRTRVADLARAHRLLTIFDEQQAVEAGGLMSYAASIVDLSRRAATYVDKILKGAKPGELPVEQPTKFELVINLKTAKALGLTIPPSVLMRADEVIQ